MSASSDAGKAPWSDDEVELLRHRQTDSRFHEYTCGIDSQHPPLVPTRSGWVCSAVSMGMLQSSCFYRQDWAHPMDLGRVA